jgi:hypothetical protein
MPDNSGLFRKTAINNVRSPEQLNDYIKVTTPAVWTVLAAVIILLSALLFWAAFGSVELVREVNGQMVSEWVRPISFLFS